MITLVTVSVFCLLILSTVIFRAFDLYKELFIRKISSLMKVGIGLPSFLLMFYIMIYFFQMGDGYVRALQYEYDINIFKFRFLIGGLIMIIMVGWSNSVVVYIYIPLRELIYNQSCTTEILLFAQKLLIMSWI